MFVMGHQKAPPIVMSLIEFGIDTREIPGYSGYWATCDGRIIGRRGKFRKPQLNRSGYHEVTIWVGESQSRPTVHKLVMLAFEGPRPEGQEVLHRDGNKLNNSKSNLKYGTRSENQFDSAKHGTHHWLNGGHTLTPIVRIANRGTNIRLTTFTYAQKSIEMVRFTKQDVVESAIWLDGYRQKVRETTCLARRF